MHSFIHSFTVCVCACMWACMLPCAWISKNNSWFSPAMWVPRIQLRLLALMANAFTYWAILPTFECFLKNTPFIMCMHVMCMYGHRCPRVLGGQTTTWWSHFSCSTFLWVPEIDLGLPGLCEKGLYPLNYLHGPPVLPNSLPFSFKVRDLAQGLIHWEEVLHHWTLPYLTQVLLFLRMGM